MPITEIDPRYHCEAEERARRFCITLEYEDIGAKLMELRREAFEKYGCQALWNIPGDATYSGMQTVAGHLRSYGDLEAAYLAAAILKEIERRTGNAT